jgi:hypothetical protein
MQAGRVTSLLTEAGLGRRELDPHDEIQTQNRLPKSPRTGPAGLS